MKHDNHQPAPDVSFVMPCYNEEEIVRDTIRDLFACFEQAGHRLQLVTVDNGSTDGTGEILTELAANSVDIIHHRVDVNEGYGHGVLCGLPLCTAPWVGIVVADGQVEARDVVKLFEVALRATPAKLVKVRRRFRMDGLKRKVVSVIYNYCTTIMFGGLGSIDINGSPKILPREFLSRMQLESKDWFLDAEILIKAKRLGLGVFEMNVFAQMRPGGTSNVNAGTCAEFLANLLRYRLGGGRTSAKLVQPAAQHEHVSGVGK